MFFDADLLNQVKDLLVKKKETLAVAESVTSGFLQMAFGSADEASSFFHGGITAYNLGQKCRHLSVDAIHALESDSVSEEIATQMAVNVAQLFVSHIGIGITGYATTSPEKNINELFAYYAIARKEEVLITKRIESNTTEGTLTQLHYAEQVLQELYKVLLH